MWILFFFLLAPFTPKLDLLCSNLFYSQETGFYDNCFFRSLFVYGELLGLSLGVLACLIFLLSYRLPPFKKWRLVSLALVLTLVVGAGIITNWGFKGHWGRPRPKQLVEFGGTEHYRSFWRPDFSSNRITQKSFPSGHVAMGFYFLSLCLSGRRYRLKIVFYIGLGLSLFLGCGLMAARIVQGGHFLSDVLASLLIMWYTARAVDKCVNLKADHSLSVSSSDRLI